jgi:glyoxylase-like metal-dependent hydrolase (beta-lactamase superfamily II)
MSGTIPTSKISPNVCALKSLVVNFFIYTDDRTCICFDTGFMGAKHAAKKLGLDPDRVSHIFLTHTDSDHVSGIKAFPNAKVFLSAAEEPMINGSVKRSPIMKNKLPSKTYTLLRDNEVVTIEAVEVRAISTPGHTIGSMSYLVNKSLLFAGDTIHLKKGIAGIGPKYLTMNFEQQKSSLNALAGLRNISLLCTCHSGFTSDFRAAMKRWEKIAD